MNKSQLLILLYTVLSAIEIIGDILGNWTIIYLTKPLLMPVLLIWFLLETKLVGKFRNIIAVSIVAAFFGDTFLMLLPINENFFLLGLGSFLIGQLLYGWGFILNIKKSIKRSNKNFNAINTIVFAVFYVGLMAVLYPNLSKEEEGAFLIPVLIYGLAICFMGLTAAFRFNKVTYSSFIFCFLGALTFVISDTCIAIDKFYFEDGFPYAQALIMLTYCSAQYLLVKGSIIHLNEAPKPD